MIKNYAEQDIKALIKTKVIGKNILFFDTIDSTNDYLKKNSSHFEEGVVVIAKNQTKGRGRRGNVWESGSNENIFMSVLLKPNVKVEALLRISLVCSLAILKALEFTGLDLSIKWPNDIIVNNKKVCGILTECINSNEESNLILGIGINVNNNKFSDDLIDKATSLYLEKAEGSIPEIISAVLENIEKNYYTYLQFGFSYFINEYKDKCININKEVIIINGGYKEKGTIIDINSDGSLLFKNSSGETKKILSNEVSIRGINGYV